MATRVLVCDDSPLLRRVIADMLTEDGMEVVGEARDGVELVARAKELRPDVITLDVEMPRCNGLDGLRVLMAECPTPVVMVSSLTGSGADATASALASGAVDAVRKPAMRISAAGWGETRADLLRALRGAAGAKVAAAAAAPVPARPGAGLAGRAGAAGGPLVVIACSTGGPRALQAVIPRLPSPLGAGVLIVQHMPVGFTESLARRLDADSALAVREAAAGDAITPDAALIAPAGWHLELSGRDRVRLSDAPPIGALRPRADVTLQSAARHFRSGIVAVVLTGMGDDGVVGCAAVRAAGGRVIVEAESTAVVWGMPGAVVAAGHAEATVPLDAMPLAIAEAAAAVRAR
jgi:two-component system, chemotaxis family, protein-glutamate methylesterase/glutaminase